MEKRGPSFSVGILFLCIIALGASFRFSSLFWGSDAQRNQEEEEFLQLQHIINFPASFTDYLSPSASPLNVLGADLDYSYPIYGSFPAFLAKVAIPSNSDFTATQLRKRGRVAGAMTDMIVLLLVGLIGIRTFSTRVGLLAMTIYALFPLPIAHAHFFSTDWAAILANTLILCIILPDREDEGSASSVLSFILFGLFFGLATAIDPRNLLLAAMLPFLFLVRGVNTHSSPIGRRAERYPISFSLFSTGMTLISAWLALRLAQPYAFVENSLIEFDPRFIDAGEKILLGENAAIPSLGQVSLDLSGHFAKFLEFGLWSFGPLGFVVLILVLAGGAIPRALFSADLRSMALGTVVFAYFILPIFQTHPDPDTLLFACPAAALLIADFIFSTFPEPPATKSSRYPTRRPLLLPALVVILVGTELISTLISSSQFSGEHPLDIASQWLAAKLPTGRTILVEHESVRLPGPIEGKIPGPYRFSEFTPLGADFSQSDRYFVAQLRKADAIVLSSSAAREIAEMNPGPASAFYHELFGGKTDFELAANFHCTPRMMTWEQFRSWVPPEVRYDTCPDVAVFLPKSPGDA